MPHMQRLTWTGIRMHSGNPPGYPASRGGTRMPFDFSQRVNPEFATKLYEAIVPGTKIVVADQLAVRQASRDFTVLAN